MCIRDRPDYPRAHPQGYSRGDGLDLPDHQAGMPGVWLMDSCLLYTSDAADERSSVDLGGRRIIKKKNWAQL